jgi:hypothetical protein
MVRAAASGHEADGAAVAQVLAHALGMREQLGAAQQRDEGREQRATRPVEAARRPRGAALG